MTPVPFWRASSPQHFFKMTSVSRKLGRILAAGLIIFLVAQIIMALGKLRDEKTAVSTTTQYEQSRLMPSFSICFHAKKVNYQGNDGAEYASITLNQTRQVELPSQKNEHSYIHNVDYLS